MATNTIHNIIEKDTKEIWINLREKEENFKILLRVLEKIGIDNEK